MNKERLIYKRDSTLRSHCSCLENSTIPLLDIIATGWTTPEATAVHLALSKLTQEQSAEKWPQNLAGGKKITRQAVAQSLQRAYWNTVEQVLEFIEKASSRACM